MREVLILALAFVCCWIMIYLTEKYGWHAAFLFAVMVDCIMDVIEYIWR